MPPVDGIFSHDGYTRHPPIARRCSTMDVVVWSECFVALAGEINRLLGGARQLVLDAIDHTTEEPADWTAFPRPAAGPLP